MTGIYLRLWIRTGIRRFFKTFRIVLLPVLFISPFRFYSRLEGFFMKGSAILARLLPHLFTFKNLLWLLFLIWICVIIEGRRVRIYCFNPQGEKFYLGSEFLRFGLPFFRKQYASFTIPPRMSAAGTTIRYMIRLPHRFPKAVSKSRLFIRINHEITEIKARKTVKFHIEKNHLSQYTKT